MPVVLDGMDNVVAKAYGGWPDRLYLIGLDGTVVFQGSWTADASGDWQTSLISLAF